MLSHKIEIPVRFNEADPLGVVWHGHFLRYFEDGREAFGKQFGISYLDMYHHGLAAPIVSIQCDYKKPLRYGDAMTIIVTLEPTQAAKLQFCYKIYKAGTDELMAEGTSTQVFVDAKTFELHLTTPAFLEQWKNKWSPQL